MLVLAREKKDTTMYFAIHVPFSTFGALAYWEDVGAPYWGITRLRDGRCGAWEASVGRLRLLAGREEPRSPLCAVRVFGGRLGIG